MEIFSDKIFFYVMIKYLYIKSERWLRMFQNIADVDFQEELDEEENNQRKYSYIRLFQLNID